MFPNDAKEERPLAPPSTFFVQNKERAGVERVLVVVCVGGGGGGE
jgi:hypothetical protein